MEKENLPTRKGLYAVVFLAAALAVFILSFRMIAPILLSFILILLVALAANPLVMKIRRWTGGRILATGLIVVVFLGVLALTGWAFYRPISSSTEKFFDRLPQYWERVQRPLVKIQQKAIRSQQRIQQEVSTQMEQEETSKTNSIAGTNLTGNGSPDGTNQDVVVQATNVVASPVASDSNGRTSAQDPTAPATSSSGNLLQSSAGLLLGGMGGGVKSLASNLSSIGFIVITVFFGTVFTLLRPGPVLRGIFGMIPETHHPTSKIVAERIANFVPRWAIATLIGMAIIGGMIFCAMWPIFGFQDALVLGLIAFVFEAVPYVGPILAAVPALLLGIGEGGLTIVWVAVGYIGVQALENNLIMPVVVGGQLRLHPVAVIFSMLICVTVFGVLGVLIAMPTVAILTILHEEIYRPKYLPNVTEDDLETLSQAVLHNQKKNSD